MEEELLCIGCGQPPGKLHGEECIIGFILKDPVTADDCFKGEEL